MARIHSAVVKTQPTEKELPHAFGVLGNEKINLQWNYEKKGIGGRSMKQQNTLTDTRLLMRANQSDASIFLRDIAQIQQTTEMRDNGTCCAGCCCSARDEQVFVLKGIFGKKLLYIPEDKLKYLRVEIARLAGNEKLVARH